MTHYLYVIFAYLLILTILNFYRARKVKSQDDFIVAGRSLSVPVMVFTLICTWIGSGTFIAGAEFSYKAGLSGMWMAAGAWLGIVVIYFLAGRIRTFGQYTIGDILEVRYGKMARIFGCFAIVISFTTIVSYQFKAGGFILQVATDGAISDTTGMWIAAIFVILFTALGGMVAVAYTDLPNGIVILLACVISLPFLYFAAGGWEVISQQLPASHFSLVNEHFGEKPFLKALGYFFSTFLLLMGVQSMYQKFYSAKTPAAARMSVAFWTLGTVVVETLVVLIAVFGSSIFKGLENPAKVVLVAARNGVPMLVGVLLLGASCVVVLSTAMNYLLSPTTNIVRDVYQQFINKEASQRKLVILQKICVVVLGILAFLVAWQMQSVLSAAFFAYTIYGVAVTPALLAALVWKRASAAGGLASIISGTFICLVLKAIPGILSDSVAETYFPDGDPLGIPLIFPAALVSFGTLIIVSFLTPPPSEEVLKKIFKEESA